MPGICHLLSRPVWYHFHAWRTWRRSFVFSNSDCWIVQGMPIILLSSHELTIGYCWSSIGNCWSWKGLEREKDRAWSIGCRKRTSSTRCFWRSKEQSARFSPHEWISQITPDSCLGVGGFRKWALWNIGYSIKIDQGEKINSSRNEREAKTIRFSCSWIFCPIDQRSKCKRKVH